MRAAMKNNSGQTRNTSDISGLTRILFPILFLAPTAFAASPFATDDVSALERGACQLEVWQQQNRDSRDLWVAPACSPIDGLEMSLGGNRVTGDDATRNTSYVLQAKYVVRAIEAGSWGWGWVAGGVRHANQDSEDGHHPDYYALLMAGISLNEDRLRLNVNLGGLREGETGRNFFTWGVLAEQNLGERFKAIGEIFGTQYNRPFYQVGARAALVPDHLELDATVGNRFGRSSEERWWTVSLRIITDSLFKH
jgi:hypothetical protein